MGIKEANTGSEPPVRGGDEFIIDIQTHIHWKKEGMAETTRMGHETLQWVADFRSQIIGRKCHPWELNASTFIEDVLLNSDTAMAGLVSQDLEIIFGKKEFPPEEAREVSDMVPGRVLVLGNVYPPEGPKALDYLQYQVEELKIDALKLYPVGQWWMDDERIAYPIFQKCEELGIKNICVHKGLPFLWLDWDYCRPRDIKRAARDFPNLNFLVFHAGWPFEEELICSTVFERNVYVEIGGIMAVMRDQPLRYRHFIGNLLRAFGPDRVLWGTDAPGSGNPQWQIEWFRRLQFPDELIEGYGYPQLTPEIKRKIFGENTAKLFGIDVAAKRAELVRDSVDKIKSET